MERPFCGFPKELHSNTKCNKGNIFLKPWNKTVEKKQFTSNILDFSKGDFFSFFLSNP